VRDGTGSCHTTPSLVVTIVRPPSTVCMPRLLAAMRAEWWTRSHAAWRY